MSGESWKDSLAQIDHNINKLKTVTKQVNKLESARKKYGSNVSLKRKMTLTDFDDIVSDMKSRDGKNQLNAIEES